MLIGQAVANVLENAAKYAPAGSTIRIEAATRGPMVRLRIVDQGTGIPDAEREKVFDLFYRVGEGDRRPSGTGLGLAIVRGFVEAHGGHVRALAGPGGRGTAIEMDLPRGGRTMNPPRVLVIEDETPIRRFLRIAIESAGFVMLEAERGRLGVERAATEAPDIVVLDLGLPDMDGKAVIAAIREWSQVPILVLSVRDAEGEKIAALDAGADDYVTKPFATGELLARLRALLRSRKAPDTERSVIALGDLAIDLAAHTVALGAGEVKLTRKEFDVLALLARHAGRLVTHRQLLTTVWGPAHTEDAHYLRIAIGHIREKLGDDAADPKFILTEPGVGYRLLR